MIGLGGRLVCTTEQTTYWFEEEKSRGLAGTARSTNKHRKKPFVLIFAAAVREAVEESELLSVCCSRQVEGIERE